MATQSFRIDRLSENELSDPPIPFVVLLDAAKTFLRVVAQFKDNVVLGGRAPTIFIKAGLGDAKPVDDSAGPVNIPGSGGVTVATATCQRTREDVDTFLVTINHIAASGPWQFEILNNEPEALEFYVFISPVESETLKPWIGFGSTVGFRGARPDNQQIIVRNLGSAALIVEDEPGDRLGPDGSPASIFAKPGPILPHRTATIVVECDPLPEVFQRRVETLDHTFTTNDPNRAHGKLTFSIDPPVRVRPVRPHEPPAQTFCRMGDGCLEFRPGPETSRCAFCGHLFAVHVDVPPDHGGTV